MNTWKRDNAIGLGASSSVQARHTVRVHLNLSDFLLIPPESASCYYVYLGKQNSDSYTDRPPHVSPITVQVECVVYSAQGLTDVKLLCFKRISTPHIRGVTEKRSGRIGFSESELARPMRHRCGKRDAYTSSLLRSQRYCCSAHTPSAISDLGFIQLGKMTILRTIGNRIRNRSMVKDSWLCLIILIFPS